MPHFEFLSCDGQDPREKFCRGLWEVVKDCRSIVHYTGFEIREIKAMAADGIPLASELLEALEARTFDLHAVVDTHVYFEEFMGRTSIKVVLPVLVPGMSYKDLVIGDGLAAAAGFREMIDAATSASRKAELREALLKYCEQDTLAMVEIYHALLALSA